MSQELAQTLRLFVSRAKAKLSMAAFPIALLSATQPACAGVPYSTDDAGTPAKGHYEINVGSQITSVRGDQFGTVLGVEVNYGLTDRVELHAFAPLAFDNALSGSAVGPGDDELGVKYRFLDDDEHGWAPNIGIAPALELPSGSAQRNLGTGHVHGVIPLVLDKAFKRWNVFANAGYTVNPGAGSGNSWFSGIGVTYALTPLWSVGTEIFHIQPTSNASVPTTSLCAGVTYTASETHHPMIAIGRGLQHATLTNELSLFVGDQITF